MLRKIGVSLLNKISFDFLIGFRFLTLLIVGVLIGVDSSFPVPREKVIFLFILSIIYVLIFSYVKNLVDIKNNRLIIYVDLLIAFLLVSLTGVWGSPFYLYTFSSIMLASYHFYLKGGLAAATIASILYTTGFFLNGYSINELLNLAKDDSLIPNYLSFFLVGIFFAYPAQLIEKLKETNKKLEVAHKKLNILYSLSNLSQREIEILELISEGLKNKDIAEKLFLSEHTVKSHLHKIFQRLNIATREDAINLYNRLSK